MNSTTFDSATSLTATVAVVSSAAVGARDLTITNPDGSAVTAVGAFTVNAAPTFTSVTPAAVAQGAVDQPLTIAGTGFVPGGTVAFSGSGVTVSSTRFDGPTSLTAIVSIAPSAQIGARTLTVVNGDGGTVSASSAFTVAAIPEPPPGPPPTVPVLSELDGSLTSPTFGAGNVGAAVFSGTTIAQLAAQVAAVGGVAVWVQDVSGQWFQFNTLASGPTALANDAFNTAFAAGFPGPVAVFVVRAPGGPPSAPPPPPPTMPVLPQADGNLTSPTFGPGKVGTAVFSGTTIAQLAAEVTAVGGIAVWVQDVSGRWLQYNTRASGSLAFVNSAFNTAFAAGLPGPVAVLVVR